MVRQCHACFRVYIGREPVCPYCGHDNGKTKQEIKEEKEAELKKISELRRDERKKARTFEELVRLGEQRGYKNPIGWAYCVLRGRGKKV